MAAKIEPLTAEETDHPFAPLADALFRSLWIASIASNIGTWMQNVGAGWLMTELNGSPLYVALIQTATSLPVFLLGIPAGAAADLFDRRRLLVFTQAFMAFAAGILGWLTVIGRASPIALLLATFALGVGSTLNNPAWQAIVPEIVSRKDLPQAISLNSVGFNLARAVGPAIGGFVIAAFNPGAVFILNAISFVGVIVVLYLWKRPTQEQSTAANESIVSATWAGLRYVRYSPGIRSVLVRSGAFVIGGSAMWAILPIVTKTELKGTATTYGVLLGCLGVGSVIAALLLAKFRLRFTPDQLIVSAGAAWGIVTILLASVDNFTIAAAAMLAGGVAWVAEMSSFNVAAQTVLPAWVRARALAAYLLVFQGGMALASMLWGTIAERYGNRASLYVAGITSLLSLLLVKRFPIRLGEEREITKSGHWPEPVFDTPPDPERGPVLVLIEYDIDPRDRAAFAVAMRELGRIRLRDGAIRWGIFQDAALPNRHVESFLVENWGEHLRQHDRATLADREIQERANRFHRGPRPPTATHWLATE
ncbi:MAG: MFS transporter [Acidobacteriaceae bacterium]|nr:MFS transporter [Acidobacteriaceae bacterium]MBV9297086.1 MFS transporter [Acidobacteriaceae bacterium]